MSGVDISPPQFVNPSCLTGRQGRPLSRISINWFAWNEHLPAMELGYQIRRDLHFNPKNAELPIPTPIDRQFYQQSWAIDGGRLLYKRFVNGEKAIIDLLEFGWVIEEERVLPPPSFIEFIEAFYRGAYTRYLSRGIGVDEFPIPTIAFRNKAGDFRFARIGIDAVPPPGTWHPDVVGVGGKNSVIPLKTYQSIYCRNRPPMNPAVFDHDMAHVIDVMNNPGYYRDNQTVFARVTGVHPTMDRLHMSEDPTDEIGYGLHGRICILHEILCLPNLAREQEIRNLLPHLFSLPKSTTINVEKLASTPHAKDPEMARKLLNKIERLVVRHGGGAVDVYNLYHDLNIRSNARDRLASYQSGNRRVFNSTGREIFSQAAVESLLGMASDLEMAMTGYLETNSHWMHKEMADLVARLELALYYGVQLHMTVDKFATDTTKQIVLPDSDSYLWLNSWVRRGSLHEQVYLL